MSKIIVLVDVFAKNHEIDLLKEQLELAGVKAMRYEGDIFAISGEFEGQDFEPIKGLKNVASVAPEVLLKPL